MKNEKSIGRGEGTRVLIVEDQGMFRAFLERWLEELEGFVPVGMAGSGEEALELLAEARPDVVMVDFQLPGIDGLELVRSARQIRPELRALVLSSLIDPLALTRVRESGVEGYVEKDASPAELEEALTSVAQGRVWFSKKYQATLAQEGARAAAVGKILSRREQEVLSLVSHRYPLARTGEAIRHALAHPDEVVKAVIDNLANWDFANANLA